MLHDQTFAFIGSGAMGEAMIKGLITQAQVAAAADRRQRSARRTRRRVGAEIRRASHDRTIWSRSTARRSSCCR